MQMPFLSNAYYNGRRLPHFELEFMYIRILHVCTKSNLAYGTLYKLNMLTTLNLKCED